MATIEVNPWSAVPPETAEIIRPHLDDVAEQIFREIYDHLPEYLRSLDDGDAKLVRRAAEEALFGFADRIGKPDVPPDLESFRELGRSSASGRIPGDGSLEALQTALRLGARVAWKNLAISADQLHLPPKTLYLVAEAIFAYLDEVAAATAEGFEEARAEAAGEMERRRRRLVDLLLAEPSASAEAIAEAAKVAGWTQPKTVAGVALEPCEERIPSLPPDVLVSPGGEPCLILPDPGGPGRTQMLDHALRGRRAAVGPAVPLTGAAKSLRWARRTLDLTARGIIRAPAGHLVRSADHMSTLVVFKDEDLVEALAAVRLAPLEHLRAGQQDRLAETLLAWLQSGHNANEVATRLHVHPQTVRYRLRQLEELYGAELADPDLRFELEIVLRARHLKNGETAPASDGKPGSAAPRSAP